MRRPLLLLLLVSILVRLPIWIAYGPVVEGDSGTYLEPARLIRDGLLHTYEGQRTPVYPLFLALAGLDPNIVAWAQGCLGILTSLMLFFMAWRHLHRPIVALAVALVQTLSIDVLSYEPFLVTEALSTFLLVAVCALTCELVDEPRARPWTAVGLGVLIGALALTRPLFVYLVPVVAAVLLLPFRGVPRDARHRVRRALGAAVAGSLMIGGWSLFNWSVNDSFGPSTMAGFNLTQVSGAIMEKAPDSESLVRDIYLKHRAQVQSEIGTHSGTIWRAIPELQQATGLSYAALSKHMGRLSIRLLADHPIDYVRTSIPGWIGFWKRANYWRPERLGPLRTPLESVWRVQRWLGVAINAVFLVIAAWLWGTLFLTGGRGADPRLLTLSGIVVLGSIVQAMVELSGNARFAVPFLPIIHYVVIVVIATQMQGRLRRVTTS